MTGSSWDDLRDRVDALREEFQLDAVGGPVVFVGAGSASDVDLSPFTVTHSPDERALADSYDEVVLPFYKPRSVRAGVTVLDAEDVARLWEIQPEDVRQRELAYRREHGQPIPPVLREEAAES